LRNVARLSAVVTAMVFLPCCDLPAKIAMRGIGRQRRALC
jgi:hypothetical protein